MARIVMENCTIQQKYCLFLQINGSAAISRRPIKMSEMPATTRLAGLIEKLCPQEGSHRTAIDDLFLTRYSTTEIPRTSLGQAVFCVVAQGSKSIFLNEQRLRYDPNQYLLVSVDLPLVGQLEEASRAKPFLGLSMVLDFEVIASLVREAALPHDTSPPQQPAALVASLDEELLDAVVRLTSLLHKPAQIPILAPLIRREIFYKLLLSEQGTLLRRMVADCGKVQRIASGLAWIRGNLTQSIRMEQLARHMRMSPSAMHSWFRAVTSMSPLQYQKQLRLQEARRMMIAESLDAGTASRRVGYESSSQFSREYRRFFGAPPMRDIEQLRAML
jgi:AraC-like DNA-binding protein